MTTERDIRNYITYVREQGAKNKARETAKNLLLMGVSEEIIVKSTGLTPEELRELHG